MVIYEVNIDVNEAIYTDYFIWLTQHIDQMLAFDGFKKVEIGFVEQQENDKKKRMRISYLIDSYQNLQNYLSNHAPKMRAEGLERFGNNFSADRRVIMEPITIEA